MQIDMPSQLPALYTIRELARALRLSEARVRRLVHAGQLRAIRVGAELRIRAADFERFLDQNSLAPEDQ